jgi:hypothetical protein
MAVGGLWADRWRYYRCYYRCLTWLG